MKHLRYINENIDFNYHTNRLDDILIDFVDDDTFRKVIYNNASSNEHIIVEMWFNNDRYSFTDLRPDGNDERRVYVKMDVDEFSTPLFIHIKEIYDNVEKRLNKFGYQIDDIIEATTHWFCLLVSVKDK